MERGFWMRMALLLAAALLLGACVPAAETPVGDIVQPGGGATGGRTGEVAPTETPEEPAGGEDPLAGSEWTLMWYGPEGALAEVPAGVQVTLRFEGGEIGGTAACNSYFGSYEVDGERLTIGAIGATEMFCAAPEGLMEQEQGYLQALGQAAGYHLEEDRLTVLGAGGERLLEFVAVTE